MVLSFFGKKSPDSQRPGDSSSGGKSDKVDLTTSMDFTHTGDVGRSLAAAAGKIQVLEVSAEDVAAIEEAAVLYANANEAGAKVVLEEAVDGPSKKSERLWQMLFDLYRLIGDKTSFDTQGVVFAQLFLKSPPVWDDPSTATETSSAPKENSPAVNLSGSLGGNARNQFEQLVRIGTRTGRLRVDLSRLRGIDETGCALLHETLDSLKRGNVKVALFGANHALTLLEPSLKVGEPEGRPFWLAALSMLQQLGDQERFEDAAVNFAITFEESPPSWDPPETVLTDSQDMQKLEETIAPPVRDNFVMDGVIGGSQPEIFRKLAVYASDRSAVEIDATNLKRLEFVSAGSLFNQLAQLQSQGKLSVIYHPNEMVAALLVVMGIDQLAQIEHKKF